MTRLGLNHFFRDHSVNDPMALMIYSKTFLKKYYYYHFSSFFCGVSPWALSLLVGRWLFFCFVILNRALFASHLWVIEFLHAFFLNFRFYFKSSSRNYQDYFLSLLFIHDFPLSLSYHILAPPPLPLWPQVLLLLSLLLILLLFSLRVFHINVSWWSFTGVCVWASLPWSLGIFSVFCSISIMMTFGWTRFVCQLPTLPLLIPRL